MKDKVFIAWSGSNEIAFCVKSILERKYNYVCSIGGNSDNNSKFSSVGDTVIQQIKSCNQAIVIFQNRKDGSVSNNLFFELGYVMAMYGMKKVHCVKRTNEEVVLPSDFDNSFVETLNESDDDEAFAENIVSYFISRQKMSINENKMYLINNRYIIHDKIVSHYSESGSKCSDYELAQYILFYMQAAHLFGDEEKTRKEIARFKQQHNYEFSNELSIAINMCLSFFDMLSNIKYSEALNDVYIDQDTFWRFKNEYADYYTEIIDDDIGTFDEWAKLFIYEHLNYAFMLFARNETNSTDITKMLYDKSKEYAIKVLDCIEELKKAAPCVENNDETGLISLLKAYVYRNLFLAKENLGEDDSLKWLKLTLKERAALKNNFGGGTIDTQLYNNFCMEYYLSLVNYLTAEENNISMFELQMYKSEIKNYIKSVMSDNSENMYLKQMARWCENK